MIHVLVEVVKSIRIAVEEKRKFVTNFEEIDNLLDAVCGQQIGIGINKKQNNRSEVTVVASLFGN